MIDLIDMALLLIMVATALAFVFIRNLFAIIMLSGIFSLTAAVLYVVMDAVDVAFTEAAVGAGIATVLGLVARLSLTGKPEEAPSQRSHIGPFMVTMITGAVLVNATLDMPNYGDPNAPIHQHVAPRYIDESGDEIGVPNIVKSVLASYRGYDTLGEVTVIFTAACGVLALLGKASASQGGTRSCGQAGGGRMIDKSILRITAKLLIPAIMLFGLYVQFHGATTVRAAVSRQASFSQRRSSFTPCFSAPTGRARRYRRVWSEWSSRSAFCSTPASASSACCSAAIISITMFCPTILFTVSISAFF